MNMRVHISFQVTDKYPEEGLLDHMIILFLIFRGIFILFFVVAVPIYIAASSA